ncbi:MAG TPA: response regulator [Bryobacteraceae bacterium]|nr:response regulator [Bryobacteraceae bacterium]
MADRVLVVDDEPALLELMCTFLQRYGFETVACGAAQAALARFRESPGHWSLVVADLSLPDMEGSSMACMMAAEQPEVKFLICSGWPFDLECVPADQRQRFSALQKPFAPGMLADAVRSLLAR